MISYILTPSTNFSTVEKTMMVMRNLHDHDYKTYMTYKTMIVMMRNLHD